MKKIAVFATVAVLFLTALCGTTVADTTFGWSGPAQSGILWYQQMRLTNCFGAGGTFTNVTLTGAAITASTFAGALTTQDVDVADTLDVGGAVRMSSTLVVTNTAQVGRLVVTGNLTSVTATIPTFNTTTLTGQTVTAHTLNINGTGFDSGDMYVTNWLRVGRATITGALTVATSISLPGASIADAALQSATFTMITNISTNFVSAFVAVAVPNANGGTNVVTVTAKDSAGRTVADYCAFLFYISDTAYRDPAAVAGDVVVAKGWEIKEITDKAVYQICTTNSGSVVITITDDPARTNAFQIVQPGGRVTSTPLIWDQP